MYYYIAFIMIPIKILGNTYLKNVSCKFNIYTKDLKMYNSPEYMEEFWWSFPLAELRVEPGASCMLSENSSTEL